MVCFSGYRIPSLLYTPSPKKAKPQQRGSAREGVSYFMGRCERVLRFMGREVQVGQRLRGGGGPNVSREFGGGNVLHTVLSKTLFLEASEIGVGLVGASFF